MASARSRMPSHAVARRPAGPPGSPCRRRRRRGRRLLPSDSPSNTRDVGARVAFDVGDRLLGDPPQLPLLDERQPAVFWCVEVHLDAAPLLDPLEEAVEGLDQALLVGHVGAQVVRACRAPATAGRRTSVAARRARSDRTSSRDLAADAVEPEGQVGERLADAVVQVAGDAGALLVGADGAQPGEPAGVVDGQGRRLDEPVEQLSSRRP